MEKWNEVRLVSEFSEQGVDCYRVEGGNFENRVLCGIRSRNKEL